MVTMECGSKRIEVERNRMTPGNSKGACGRLSHLGRTFIFSIVGCIVWMLGGELRAQVPADPPDATQTTISVQNLEIVSGQVIPSDAATSSTQPDPSALSLHLEGKDGDRIKKARQKSAAGPSHIPSLCFQPGLGWMISAENSVAPALSTSESGPGATGAATEDSGVLHPVRGYPATGSRARPRGLASCPSVFDNGMGAPLAPSGVADGNDTDRQRRGSLTSRDSREGLPLEPASIALEGADSQRLPGSGGPPLLVGPSGVGLKGTGTANPAAPITAFQHDAYISPIKMRQLIRNAPDIETRLKLRQIQTRVEKQESSNSRLDQESQRAPAQERLMRSKHPLMKKGHCDPWQMKHSSKYPCYMSKPAPNR